MYMTFYMSLQKEHICFNKSRLNTIHYYMNTSEQNIFWTCNDTKCYVRQLVPYIIIDLLLLQEGFNVCYCKRDLLWVRVKETYILFHYKRGGISIKETRPYYMSIQKGLAVSEIFNHCIFTIYSEILHSLSMLRSSVWW